MPSMTGISTSMTMTSGASNSASRSAASPSDLDVRFEPEAHTQATADVRLVVHEQDADHRRWCPFSSVSSIEGRDSPPDGADGT
jgi:hypothetical protein